MGDQHLTALERANKVRLARAGIKRELKAGTMGLEEAMASEFVATMRISDLIMSYPRFGRARTMRILGRCMIPEQKHVGTLTERQRGAFLEAMLPLIPSASQPDREEDDGHQN